MGIFMPNKEILATSHAYKLFEPSIVHGSNWTTLALLAMWHFYPVLHKCTGLLHMCIEGLLHVHRGLLHMCIEGLLHVHRRVAACA